MESLVMKRGTFSNRRVFVTGHTGFKGAWLTQWLLHLGAQVAGYSLDPPTCPSLYEQLEIEFGIHSIRGDIRDLSLLTQSIADFRPDFVFHLAAQSLVRYSYRKPVDTFNTNTMGTINLLEALRTLQIPCSVVIVTTDKCYQNREWVFDYRETDPLGGSDPYSCSKAMAELAIESYQRSWFSCNPNGSRLVRLASARAGNVIGGGDWASDRILPDSIRSLMKNEPIPIRNRRAKRPWQHVLDPLNGYLMLAEQLASAQLEEDLQSYCSPFNFGPSAESNRTVGELVEKLLCFWPGETKEISDLQAPHESMLLGLSTNKARATLNWTSHWDFSTSVEKTVAWYRRVQDGESPKTVTLEQIEQFERNIESQVISETGRS